MIVNIVPKEIFKEIVESIKESVTVTAITQSGSETTIKCNTTDININNYVLLSCGALSGYKLVKRVYSDRIVIDYSGAYTLGTLKKDPYFDWGNLKDGSISINKLNEFPLIFLILPMPYEVNSNPKSSIFIESNFKFLIIDKYTNPNGTKKTITDDIYDSTVSRMSSLALTFQQAIENSKYILEATFKRSEEIPFGVTFSGDDGSEETLVIQSAGCYLEASVKIKKQYQCN